MEMSRRQQAGDGQPPLGPNGELKFEPPVQQMDAKGDLCVFVCVCVRLVNIFLLNTFLCHRNSRSC